MGLPVYAYSPEGEDALEPEIAGGANTAFSGAKRNLVVLSQSCDINGQKKGDVSLLLAPVYTIEEMPKSLGSPVMLEMIRQDKMLSYFMLDLCDIKGHEFPLLVIDFRGVVSMPLKTAYRYLKGGLRVIHMNSPYAEALGAAYGRSIMRVGLPSIITPFEISDKKLRDFMRDFSLIGKEKKQAAIRELEDLASQLRNDIDDV